MKSKVVVHYDLQSFTGPRLITAHYDTVGTGFRVPAVGEHVRKEGRLYNVFRVIWDLDSSPVSQEVTVSAEMIR